MRTLRIELAPAFRCRHGNWAGQGKAFMTYEGENICESREPLFAAARWLLGNGRADPADMIVTVRNGMDCMRARVEIAAGLSVSEPDKGGGPRIVPYQPNPLYQNAASRSCLRTEMGEDVEA